jgi:hypothetical protein
MQKAVDEANWRFAHDSSLSTMDREAILEKVSEIESGLKSSTFRGRNRGPPLIGIHSHYASPLTASRSTARPHQHEAELPFEESTHCERESPTHRDPSLLLEATRKGSPTPPQSTSDIVRSKNPSAALSGHVPDTSEPRETPRSRPRYSPLPRLNTPSHRAFHVAARRQPPARRYPALRR